MLNRLSCLNFTWESSFEGTPLDWSLVNIFEDSLITANRIKPLSVRSTNGIVTSLDKKIKKIKKSKIKHITIISHVICSTESLIFMAPRQQIMMTTETFDRMSLLQNKVRFSDALLVSHRIIKIMIRHRIQNIFKFIFMLNFYILSS